MKKHKRALAKGLYRRADSAYIWMRFTDQHGVTVCRSTGTDNPVEAQAVLEKCRTDVREGRWFDKKAQPAKVLFAELLDKYAEYAATHTPRSWKSDQYIVKRFRKALGGYMLSALGFEAVEKYRGSLAAEGLAVASVNDMMKTLKHIMVKGNDWKMVTDEQLREIQKLKKLKGENKRLRYLTPAEIPVLLSACNIHIRPIVQLAINTGMRRGEIFRLRWCDVDEQAGIIMIGRTKTDEGRSIPMNATVKALLADLKKTRQIGTQLVFPNKHGHVRDNMQSAWENALKRASIEDFHFHDLRHTFASQLLQAGASLAEVQKLLGHKSITMTMRYAHLCHEQTTEAVRKLDERINSSATFSLRSKAVNE